MGPIQTWDDLRDMLRRRALLIVLVTVLGAVAAVFYALSQPHSYTSYEVIQIARPKIADELAPSTVQGSSARRLQLIEQRLMTRASMSEIIEAYGLYSDMPGLKAGEKVDLLRRSIRIDGVAAAREGFADDGTMSVLTITVDMPTPQQAQSVAQELAHRTINLSVDSRLEQARETLEFFTVQENTLAAELVALEDEITAFRNTHDLSLPGSVESRREEIGAINQALLEIDRERIALERAAEQEIRTAREATAKRLREDYDDKLATLAEQRRLLDDRRADLAASIETTPDIDRALNAFQRDKDQLQGQLDIVSTRRIEAEVGFGLESRRQAERLTVIEPATLPEYPSSGSRKKLAAMGAVASFGLALLVAFLLELRNPVIRSAAQMKREIGLDPVVSIPYLDTRARRPRWFARRA